MPNLTFVVYLYIPTSNHNVQQAISKLFPVVYLYIPTSNHNIVFSVSPRKLVVYLYIPTSNHNVTKNAFFLVIVVYLYIPTSNHNGLAYSVCALGVVYLYIPTSNHNYKAWYDTYAPLYIFIFLHQTTTSIFKQYFVPTLYIFIFLHQTTTHSDGHNFDNRCISLYSYIKPQLITTNPSVPMVVYLYIPTSNHNLKKRIY